MRKWIIYNLVLVFLLGCFDLSASSVGRKKRKDKKETVQPGKYEKLFQNKSCTTVSSRFMTLHKMDGKLYFELPLKWLGKEMLLASTVTKTSDNLAAVCGYSPSAGIHFRFVLQDSTIQMRQVAASVTVDQENERMRQVVEQGYDDPVLYGYKVLAYNRDSSAIVFEVTSLFTSDVATLSPIVPASGQYRIKGSMNPSLSLLGDIKAFENNVTIGSSLSYSVNAYFFVFQVMKQVPVSVEVTRTLMMLPEEKMRPRLSDSRLGVFLTEKKHIPADGKEIQPYSIVRRWKIEPLDMEAYRRGELTEPVKPIVMYVDDHFPENWKAPIKKGILRWNRAFEKIGFKNVIQVRDFPTDDPSFDPYNLKYSCVRYLPFTLEESVGPFWVDPSSGEILNARILIFNDVVKAINTWRFVQTAQIDPSVRARKMPDAIVEESLEQMVAQAMGNCLGLMNNMAASHAFPVDSLRSVTFTRKYGITPSIMDKVRYNYVAQPEDKGVVLTPPDLGVYDEFVIKWLYSLLPEVASVQEEARMLESWVDEKVDNSLYRYGKRQWMSAYDPSALDEDLGDDALKAGDYGIANLKYIVPRMKDWIDRDATAEQRRALYEGITQQYERLLNNAIANVGGIYLNEAKDGTPVDRFRPVPREIQKASAQWVLRQLRESEWLDDRDLLDKFSLSLPESWRIRSKVVSRLLSRKSYVALSAHLADEPYPMAEFMEDVYREVWKAVLNGEKLSPIDRMMQVDWMDVSRFRLEMMGGKQFTSANTLLADPVNLSAFGTGYGWQEVVSTRVLENEGIYFYKFMRECREMLEERVLLAPAEDRPHYRAMLMMANKILEGNI